jgi:serine/threonine-protein kinase
MERPANAPRGHCPGCLLQQGLASKALSLARGGQVGATVELAGPPSVLETLAATLGPVPRALLRDTEPVTGPGPVVKPSSPEMPALADRSARLQLLGEIARGGMGAILRGRDVDIGRDLAIKVLLESHRDRPEFVRRFIEEAQIAGQLQHPGIAPIYELGAFADRRPYFAMKLVKGQTLAGLLDGRADPRMELHRYLGIFEAVCQTMAYAHARGVIHRDLKPSNVMVGSFGEVQVMDWGLAKVLPRAGPAEDSEAGKLPVGETVIHTPRSGSDSDLSVAGSVMGTPAYMAPEQARGDVDRLDERCDVFALGSMLCEILTGRAAFTGRTVAEIQRKAARGDLTDARARLDDCAADAELVALGRDCLAAELVDRPRDAGVVAQRMLGYLASFQERMRQAELARAAESARAEEAVRRAAVERDRRRLTVALAASVLAMALVLGGGGTYLARQRAAREAATAVAVNRAMAEAALLWDQARRAPVGDLAAWGGALGAARRAAELLEQGEGGFSLRGRVDAQLAGVTRGEAAARAQARAAEADRQMAERLVEIRTGVADQLDREQKDLEYAAAFRRYGIDVDALAAAEAGTRIAAQPIAVELASAVDHWAHTRAMKAPPNWEGARRLLDVANVADPDPWRISVREAIWSRDSGALRRLAETADVARLPEQSIIRLGFALAGTGDVATAVALLLKAQPRYRDDFWINFDLAGYLWRTKPPRVAESLRYSMACLALRPRSWMAYRIHAGGLRLSGDLDGAITLLRDGVRTAPDSPGLHMDLGIALLDSGHADEAASEFRKVVQLRPGDVNVHSALGLQLKARRDPDAVVHGLRAATQLHPDDAAGHYVLAQALNVHGQFDAAIAEYRAAIRLGLNDPAAQFYLAGVLLLTGDLDGAIAALREALWMKSDVPYFHLQLGHALRAKGDLDAAIAEFREALRLMPGGPGIRTTIGSTLRLKGNLDGAIAEHRAALRTVPWFVLAHIELGIDLLTEGDLDGAIAECREALRMKPDSAEAHHTLGNALRGRKDLDGAIAELREALRINPNFAEAQMNLGVTLKAKGDFDGAVTALRRVREKASASYNPPANFGDLVARAERQAKLAQRLPGFLRGDERPGSPAEALDVAEVAGARGFHVAAARLAAEALAAEPKPAEDPPRQARYNAACSAALAGCGQGKDDLPYDDAGRQRLRRQALVWLQAELAARSRTLESNDASARRGTVRILRLWKADPDLAGVREPAALEKLPEAERAEWRALWAEVDQVLVNLENVNFR